MNDKTPIRPRFAAGRRILLLVIALALVCSLAAVLKFFYSVDSFTWNTSPRVDPKEAEMDELQTINAKRVEVSEIKWDTVSIAKSLDRIEADMKECAALRETLLKSVKGTPESDKYIANFCNDRQKLLPGSIWLSRSRESVAYLSDTPLTALKQNRVGYRPDQETRDKLSRLASGVEEALVQCTRQVRLMRFLMRRIGEMPSPDPRTLQAKVLEYEAAYLKRDVLEDIKEFERLIGVPVTDTVPHEPTPKQPAVKKNASDRDYEAVVKPTAPAEKK
jgi:hypothetical protein